MLVNTFLHKINVESGRHISRVYGKKGGGFSTKVYLENKLGFELLELINPDECLRKAIV